MTASNRSSGLDIRAALVLALLILIAFGAAAVWAAGTAGVLDRTKASLATTKADLETTSAMMSTTKGKLDTATTSLADEQAAIKAGKIRVMGLELQIQRKGECVAAQTANLTELRRILAIQRSNFDKTTTGSPWGKARTASNKAMNLAIDYLRNAYTSAAAKKYGTANTWISRSNAQVAASNKQVSVMNREIDRINANTDAINKAQDAIATTLDGMSATCGA